MKTFLLLGLMQIALLPAFAQRGGGGHNGGHSGGQNYSGGRFNGGGRNNGGGHYNGGPAVTHSFGRPSIGGNYNHYSEAPHVRGGGYYGHDNGGQRFAYAGRGYYGAHPYYRGDYGRGYGYAPRILGDHFYRNWAFGWGLGLWNPALVWQQSFYVDLYNSYNGGGYYAPNYYNGYVSNFDQVIQSINNQQYDENKMAVAKEAIQNRNISSSQTAEIMNCFANEQAKIDFAEFAYTHVSDKQNFYTVNNTFKQPDSAQQLGAYLDAQYGSHTDPGN